MAQRYQQPQSGPFKPAYGALTAGLSILALPNGTQALDILGGINSQSVSGTIVTGATPVGKGLIFDGSSQLNIVPSQAFSITNGFTVVVAFIPGNSNIKSTLFTVPSLGGGSLQFARNSTNGFAVDAQQAAGVFSTGSLGVVANTINVVALSWVGSTWVVALNGAIAASGTSSRFFGASTSLIIGGRVGDSSEAFAGGIAGFAVYTRAVTAIDLGALTGNFWQLFAPAQRTVLKASAAGGGVSASVTATDGADVLAAIASVIASASSATTDGTDLLTGNASVIVSASSATTDGADVLAANVTPQAATTSVSVATTDGADLLASSISVIATASSATTDGADTLAATVAPSGTAISSNTADGADVLAAAVGPQVAAASATADGMDVLAASAGPIVGVASTTVDGADTLVGNVAPVQSVAVSVALVDGADVVVANVFTSAPGGGGGPSSEPRKKKRFLVNHDGQTLAFDSRRAADRAVYQLGAKAVLVAQPATVVDTAARMAAQRVLDDAQDEEDLEMLLLAL